MIFFDQIRGEQRAIRWMAIIVFVGLAVLAAGLWHVQIVSYNRYASSEKDQSFRTVRIPAVRGKIMDRNGVILAESQPSYNLVMYLDELRKKFSSEYFDNLKPAWIKANPGKKLNGKIIAQLERESRYKVCSNLVQQISDIYQQPISVSEREFNNHYRTRLALPLKIMSRMNSAQIAKFFEQKSSLPGIDIETEPLRVYPYTNLAAHVLGYLRKETAVREEEEGLFDFRMPDFKGVIGVEATFDEHLRGKAGAKSVLVNSFGYRKAENIWTEAEPGSNVVLTLDFYVQRESERALEEVGKGVQGAVVVMDSRNGDILAMASRPAFDPNMFVTGISIEVWKEFQDPQLRPEVNRATKEDYPPGSVFKIIVGLAGLESGILDPKATFLSEGRYVIGKRPWRDTAGPGEFDFYKAFILSSNPYFIDYGIKITAPRILEMARRFHFGELTGIPLNQEAPGLLLKTPDEKRRFFPREPWNVSDTANLSIGQGLIDVTPVQVAVMTAAIANGGTVYKPRIVEAIETSDPLPGLNEPLVFPHEPRSAIGVQPANLEIVRHAMFGDVHDEGSGKAARVEGMRIGAKTGTAQVRGGQHRYITWFASFGFTEVGPLGGPGVPYVVVVMVEGGGSGGGTCAPVAKKIFEALKQRETMGVPNRST